MLVVSYGGGINSKALLVGMFECGINPDAILFADTGGESPHTYADIASMESWLSSIAFPSITVVKVASKTLEQDCLDRKALPSVAYGYKTCSQRFKREPQEKWLNNWEPAKAVWKAGHKITKVIGFDADEPQRAQKYESDKYTQWYPLLDWNWGREECIEAIDRAKLSQPGKSSCFFCPNRKTSEIRELADQYPELIARAIHMEQNAELTSIKGLGRTWSWEDLLRTKEVFGFPDRFSQMPCDCFEG
ncbi:hypothetical protein AB835_08045 [Candidatus Endobugula sertula]|uniref:Phosphoadenosine phosphosulphate reductase domain-containing protein n=1 Tax=Candidatus Endobugula sertula TaxID=62101 RepID=A0A1D2QPR6_9GAMM|nr:hypothetical protein AB835_08045 [Candidatus Endobugula sertula]